MERRELEFTTRLTREDVAGLIEALIEGLKDGNLKIKKSDEVLELTVPRVVDLEVEASIDDERAEFEIEVSWRTNRAENPDLPLSDPEEEDSAEPGKKTAAAKPPAKAKKADATGKSASQSAPKSAPKGASKSKSASASKKSAAPSKAKQSKTGAATAAKGKAKPAASNKE